METIDLGTHTVEIDADQTVTLADERVAIALDRDEAYKLLVTLQTMFQLSM